MSQAYDKVDFNYDNFKALQESELVNYIEPLLYNPSVFVSSSVLERIASEADTYDEYHFVYAIEFGMERSPNSFTSVAVRALANEHQSVRLAAHRQLLWLPASSVTPALIDACEEMIKSRQHSDVADIVEQLRKKRVAPVE